MADLTESYSPRWAPHVVGRYERRAFDPTLHVHEPQRYVVTCAACGAEHRGECASGMVRDHIATFARVHVHAEKKP